MLLCVACARSSASAAPRPATAARPDPSAAPAGVSHRACSTAPEVSTSAPDDADAEADVDSSYAALVALAERDDPDASAVLAERFRRPEPSGRARYWDWWSARALALEHLWRNARTSEVGLCPGQPTTRHVEALAPGALDGPIGTTHPLGFGGVARDGRWVLVCQARRDTDRDGGVDAFRGHHGPMGDELRPYLVVQSGPGWGFDDFVAVDPKGRYLAVREGACLSIADTRSANVVTLPNADLRDDDASTLPRGAAFDPSGSRLVYLRAGARPAVVVRDLATGSETSVDPGPGIIYSARLDPAGPNLMLEVSPTSKWPLVLTNATHFACRGARAPRPGFPWTPDYGGVVRRILPLDDGVAREGRDIVAPFGDDLLIREPDGALALRKSSGEHLVLAPGGCQGTLLHADPGRQSIVVACANPGGGSENLWIFRPDGSERIGEVWRPLEDWWGGAPDRFVVLDDLRVDMDARRVVSRPLLAPTEVRAILDFATTEQGHFAERGDGAVLGLTPVSRSLDFPCGPLRWRRPANAKR